MITLEVCANSITSALAAQKGGAARVELCANLNQGGITPSYGEIVLARKLLKIPSYILIRPRPGDFLYSDEEYEVMKVDINAVITAGCAGIVVGILDLYGQVDKARCKPLIDLAKNAGLGVTFNRAFDMANNQIQALEDIIELGCDRLLTSGAKSTAIEGAGNIAHLVKIADKRIKIMPGGGINEYNIASLVHFTGAKEFHTSARNTIDSKMFYHNDQILLDNSGEEYTIDVTDAERVKTILKLANS